MSFRRVVPHQINTIVLASGASAGNQPLDDGIAYNFRPKTPSTLSASMKCAMLKQAKVSMILR